MSKDPATLWYWNDWQGGTVTFTRHLKGCYMDLLHAQFNNGHLSLDEIKTVLGADFSYWNTLQKKFVKDESGLFYNIKAEEVQLKRRAFSESRVKNLSKNKESPHMDSHMDTHMENEIEIVNKDLKQIETKDGSGLEQYIYRQWHRKLGYSELTSLIEFSKKYTWDKVFYAIDQSVLSNAPNIRYVEGVLKNNGKPKKKPPSEKLGIDSATEIKLKEAEEERKKFERKKNETGYTAAVRT